MNTPTSFNQFTIRTRQQRWQELSVFLLLIYNAFAGSTLYNFPPFFFIILTQPVYFGLIILWLLNLRRQKRAFPRTPLDLPLLLLTGVILISTIFSLEPRLSLNDLPLYFVYVMVYYMVIDRLRAGWSISIFLRSLMLTTSVVCIIAGLEYLAWYTMGIFGSGQGWWPIGGWQNPIPPSIYRLSFTMFNPNLLGLLLAIVLPIWWATALITHSYLTRIIMIIGGLVNILILLLTLSRGALLGGLVGLLMLGVLALKQKNSEQLKVCLARYRWPVLSIGVATLIAVVLVIWPVVQTLYRPQSNEFRLALWQTTLEIIRDHLFLGTGPHTYGMAALYYWDTTRTFAPFVQAHNLPLHVIATIGIPGALLVGVIALLTLKRGYHQYILLPFRYSMLMAAVLAGLVAFGIQGIGDSLLAVPSVMLPVIILAAISSAKTEGESPSHLLLTSGRSLLLAMIMVGWVGWSLYGLAKFDAVLVEVGTEKWKSAVGQLDELPVGALPHSFYLFQRGLIYGKLALNNPADEARQIAIANYQEGLAITPVYLPGHANLAGLYWQLGDVVNAQHELRFVIKHGVESQAVNIYRLNLGLLYEQQGDEIAAITTYGQMLAADPSLTSSVYWQENEWRRRRLAIILNQVETQFEQAYELDRLNILRGKLAYFSGDLRRAAEIFEASTNTVHSTEANIWLSQVFIEQGRFQEALAILGTILERPENRFLPQAYLKRGQANLALGRDDAAIRDLKMALFLGETSARYYQGQLALRQGDVALAISLYRQSLPNIRTLLDTNKNYDYMVYRMAYRPNIIYKNNLLPLAAVPPSIGVAKTYLEIADLYVNQGDIEAAREICRQLLELSPNYQPAQDKLATLR